MNGGQHQNGAALISAIFLIVAIAAVAAMVANLASTQQLTSARALSATSAYYAARTRLDAEIATFATAAGPACPAVPAARPAFNGFQIELNDCTHASVTEGGATYDVYTLRVAAYQGARADGSLVRRELRAVVTNH